PCGVAGAKPWIGRVFASEWRNRSRSRQSFARRLAVRAWNEHVWIVAAHRILPGLTVIEREDVPQDVVVGGAELEIERTFAPDLEIQARALRLGLAPLVLDIDARAPVPDEVRRIVQIDVARDLRHAAVHVVDHDVVARGRREEHGRHFAMEAALRVVALHIEVEKIGNLPAEPRVSAPEPSIFRVRTVLEKELRVRVRALLHDASFAAVALIHLLIEWDDGAVAYDPVHVLANELVVLPAVHRVPEEVQVVGWAILEGEHGIVP